jgi:hypothetical protein
VISGEQLVLVADYRPLTTAFVTFCRRCFLSALFPAARIIPKPYQNDDLRMTNDELKPVREDSSFVIRHSSFHGKVASGQTYICRLPPKWQGAIYSKGGFLMSDAVLGLRVGQKVPSFEIDIYDAVQQDFGTISLDRLKSEGKWTILFFYPADFTFV